MKNNTFSHIIGINNEQIRNEWIHWKCLWTEHITKLKRFYHSTCDMTVHINKKHIITLYNSSISSVMEVLD